MRGTRTEREAAEALTGLAHGVPGKKRRTGNGKRRMKLVAEKEERERVEVESLPIVDSAPIRPDLVQAEKEAKRIRRVLANRESARRTIRRRQALCEDLTSKAAELIEENRRLKKTKELALKENESLETKNKNLKAQIVSTELKPALGNTRRVHSSANGNCHEGTSNAPQLTPSVTLPSLCQRDLLHEQEKLLNMAGPGPPVYMVPCHWFVTSCSEMGNFDESSADNPSSSLGSDVDDLPPVTVKVEPPDFIVGDLNDVPIESPPLGSSSSSQVDIIPKFAKFLEPCSEEANHGNGFGLDLKCGSFDSVPVRSSNQENIQQTVLLGKKLGDVVAVTEVRRRRREITKLKSVNGHQC